jgi:hypothetical protein
VTTPFTAEEELWQSASVGANIAAMASAKNSTGPNIDQFILVDFMIRIRPPEQVNG